MDFVGHVFKFKNAWKKMFIFPLRYYANCVSTTLTVFILHNIESVYFFYSNAVFHYLIFVWPYIIDINIIDNQLDEKITAY